MSHRSFSASLVRHLAAGAALLLAAAVAPACDRAESKSDEAADHDHEDGKHTHDPDENTNLPSIDACTIVPKADAAKITGAIATAQEGASGVVADQKVCGMTYEADKRFGINVGLTDHNADGKFAAIKEKYGPIAEDVDAAGTHSVWIEPFRTLVVLDEARLLSIQMTDTLAEPVKVKEQAIKLAAIAVPRLPEAKAAK